MKLFYSQTSPFVRKVNVLAKEMGIDDQVERIATNPWESRPELVANNPLSKIPALLCDDGEVLFDSPVICEYLDSVYGKHQFFPVAGKERWQALRTQALADGILDAAILRFMEKKREEKFSADWDVLQKGAVERGLAQLEQECAGWDERVRIGQIAAACALGYLDFRFNHEDWRPTHPNLKKWYEGFAQRPSMQATVPRLPV